MKKTLLTSLSIFLLSLLSFSQPLSKAEFRQYFIQGNLLMLENYYDTAVRTFLRLYSADPTNAYINYKIGLCFLKTPSAKLKSIPYLENALKHTQGNYKEDIFSEKNAPEDVYYYLGQAYHLAYRFDEAIFNFNKFRDMVGKWNLQMVKDIDRRVEMCKNAKTITAQPIQCHISNLTDSVNSPEADYSPVISADESVIIFTSRREGTGGKTNVTPDLLFFEDLWVSYQGKYGTWTKAKGLSRQINTDGNEATIGLSADGSQLYVYRDDKGDGNIYISKLEGEHWNVPNKLEDQNVNTTAWEPSACVSPDGNTMYFVSNRSGGEGGRDIYRCRRLPNRTWSEPENLGPTINTPFDEDAPFMHPDGSTFIFSSNGHNSIGGFDVFTSTLTGENTWSQPTNIGYPVNTTDDDIYFVISSDGRRGYYASLRPEGKGEKDLYMVSFTQPLARSVAILVGYIKTRDGSPLPKQLSITAKSKDGKVMYCRPNEATGKFIQSLLPGTEYELKVEANNQQAFYDRFYLPEDSSYRQLGRGFFQRTIYLGDTTRLFSASIKDTSSKAGLTTMRGKLLLSANPESGASQVGLQLMNTQGNIIASTKTDSAGNFTFNNISSNQSFLIKINETDSILKKHQQFYLANQNNQVIKMSEQDSKFFLFKNLPADLNKLSSLDQKQDDTKLIKEDMQGQLVTGKKADQPVVGATVELSDSKNKLIQSAKTDQQGKFTFRNLSSDQQYALSLKAGDPALKGIDRVYLKNAFNQIVRAVPRSGDRFTFKNLPVNLNSLQPMELPEETSLTGPVTQPEKTSDNSRLPDSQYDFVIYFGYNKKEIDIAVSAYIAMIDKVEKMIAEKGSATIEIFASSSTVPTRTFTSNEALADLRANDVKDKIHASAGWKNLDAGKIRFEVKSGVQGPAYKNDAIENRSEYEKWQYIKVLIR